jgi:hypothetical protein
MEDTMRKNTNKNLDVIEADSVEEVREGVKYALESKSWSEVEDVLDLLNDILGYDSNNEEEDDDRRNHLEE